MFFILLFAVFLSSDVSAQATLVRANYYYDHYDYAEAIPYYLEVARTLKRSEKASEIRAKLGDCYFLTDNLKDAEYWYSEALKSAECKPVVKLNYGKVEMQLGKYDPAKTYLYRYYAATGKTDARAWNLVRGCDSAAGWLSAIPEGVVQFLDLNTDNSEFGPTLWKDNTLVFASDTSYGVKKETDGWTGKRFFNIYQVKCTSKGDCDNSIKPLCQTEDVNIRYHDGPCTFTNNGEALFFTRSRYKNNRALPNRDSVVLLEVMCASGLDVESGQFKEMQSFPHNSKHYSVAFPTVSPDGNTMVFSCNKKGGRGSYDLYMCGRKGSDSIKREKPLFKLFKREFFMRYLEKSNWSEPRNLGTVVNTEGDEIYPYLADDTTLFFSSDGHPGLGGLDIYKCTIRLDPASESFYISPPEHLKIPLNSSRNDVSLALYADGRSSYFSSNRPAQKKGDNIYYYRQKKVILKIEVVGSDSLPVANASFKFSSDSDSFKGPLDANECFIRQLHTAEVYKYDLSARAYGYDSVSFTGKIFNTRKDVDTLYERIILPKRDLKKDTTCGTITVKLTVRDSVTRKKLSPVDVKLIDAQNPDNNKLYRADTNGIVYHNASPNKVYLLEVLRPRYRTLYDTVTVGNCVLGRDITISKEIDLVRNDTFDIVVQFGYDSANVTPEAQKSLEILVQYMKDSILENVKLVAHTDCRGEPPYNMKLSKRRADSVFRYLDRRGIGKTRVDTVYGVGESYQKILCCNCASSPQVPWRKVSKKKVEANRKKDETDCQGNVPCQETDHYKNRRLQFIFARRQY